MARAKTTTQFVCSECGSAQMKWMGKCPDCNEWNTLREMNIKLISRGGTFCQFLLHSALCRVASRDFTSAAAEAATAGNHRGQVVSACSEFKTQNRLVGGAILASDTEIAPNWHNTG